MSTPTLGPTRDGATLTLTKAQTELLEASLRDLGSESDVFVARFYEHLFALRPELSELFQGADRAGMRAKLFSTLALFVDNLEEPDRVEPVLRALASRHVGYGVEPEHIPLFRTAILRTVDETYGESMTPQLRAAWEVTLSRLVQIIQPELAAAQAAAARPRAGGAASESRAAAAPAPHLNLWDSLSLASKLLLMLLGVSAISIFAIGLLGYRFGSEALTSNVYERLTSLRAARSAQIEGYFEDLNANVVTVSGNLMVVDALNEFNRAFEELSSLRLTPEQDAELEAYYRDVFVPALAQNVDGTPLVETFMPTSLAARYLQYSYTLAAPDREGRLDLADNGDTTIYNVAHRRYQPVLADLVRRYGYGDLLLINNGGQIVYSAVKGVDLGTDLRAGPYAASSLGRAFEEAQRASETDAVFYTDFEAYRPALGAPVAFVTSPVFEGPRKIGVLAFALPVDRINQIMTSDGNWEEQGLGASGETYLVGRDFLMRSQSRFFVEDPEAFATAMAASGTPTVQLERTRRFGSTILQQEVHTEGSEAAVEGQTGTSIYPDYRGIEVLGSYAPLRLPGLTWGIVAEMDTAEAFAPVRTFTRQLALWTAGLLLLVTLAALVLSRLFTGPLRRLTRGAQLVAAGDLDVEIPVGSADELGDLGHSFNEMTRSLRIKAELIEQQQRENESLILSIMPGAVARRFREGEHEIAEQFQNVTVMFADVVGFEDHARSRSASESAALLNRLVLAFDDAAERKGIEKVKTIGAGYLAVCGLSVPRVDHDRRMVEFALELERILERMNREFGTSFRLRAGIAAGAVTAGIVGQRKFVYDMWGDTVNLANRLQSASGQNAVAVTRGVYEKLEGLYSFVPGGELETRQHGLQPFWVLEGH